MIGLASPVRRVLLGAHAIGAGVFLGLQPRGFEIASRSFVEHQAVVPIFFLASLFATVAPSRWRPARAVSLGLVAGYWGSVSAVTAIVSSGAIRGVFGLVGAAACAGVLLLLRSCRRDGVPRALPSSGLAAGLLLGAAYICCTWAPPASTRPSTEADPPMPSEPLEVSLEDRWLVIGSGKDAIRIDPGFHFDSASESGYWTIFDYRQLRLPAWTVDRQDATEWKLHASAHGIEESVELWSRSGLLHIRATTRLTREVASHLSRVMTVAASGPASIEGVPWPWGDAEEPAQFLAFRGDRLDFLKASRDEKGPFELLRGGDARDPVLEFGPWSMQVIGWARQASREESPTAGWRVSQGAIERWGGVTSWSLAATSIGRGWHAVRTREGTYVLEAILHRKS